MTGTDTPASPSPSPLARAKLLARTAAHLRPSQVGHRARLRAQKLAVARWPERLEHRWSGVVHASSAPRWPEHFVALDRALTTGCPSPRENAAGVFRFLADERDLGTPIDWSAPGASQLWRYHLHYLEWAWSFLDEDPGWARPAFAELFGSWQAGTTYGRWDAWSPYVVALRTWVLCDIHASLVADGPPKGRWVDVVSSHAGYLRANLELDVGGNHLLKDLKGMAGAAVFLDDPVLGLLTRDHLERQLTIQVLADGGHFERSPSYHAQVLGDLIDVADLWRAANWRAPDGLADAIEAMRGWLAALVMPDGDVALFNDAWRLGADRLRALGITAFEVTSDVADSSELTGSPRPRLLVLEPSGYLVADVPPFHLVADVGPPCPDELPAHAQADCLSFELCVDGRRVVVDPGTSTYVGPRRGWERSTAAHSTVTVDGADQTEVWGSFRAARRARPLLGPAGDDGTTVSFSAAHDGYERLRPPVRHRRTWRITADAIDLVDEIDGEGEHEVEWVLMLAPDAGLDVSVQDGSTGSLTSTAAEVALGFGELVSARRLSRRVRATLPIRLEHRLVPNERDDA